MQRRNFFGVGVATIAALFGCKAVKTAVAADVKLIRARHELDELHPAYWMYYKPLEGEARAQQIAMVVRTGAYTCTVYYRDCTIVHLDIDDVHTLMAWDQGRRGVPVAAYDHPWRFYAVMNVPRQKRLDAGIPDKIEKPWRFE
jgi:hypothetical protein